MPLPFKKADARFAQGSGLQGHIHATYGELLETFGNPDLFESGKIRAEWVVVFADGVLATIYDFKSPNDLRDQVEWSVCGFQNEALDRVVGALSWRVP